MLRGELGFYVSCLNLRSRLVAKDETTSFPEPSEWRERRFPSPAFVTSALFCEPKRVSFGNDVDAE